MASTSWLGKVCPPTPTFRTALASVWASLEAALSKVWCLTQLGFEKVLEVTHPYYIKNPVLVLGSGSLLALLLTRAAIRLICGKSSNANESN